jgi:cytochrome c556
MIKTTRAALTACILGLVPFGAVGTAQAQSGPIDVIEVRQAGQDLLAGSFAGIATASAANADLKPFADTAAGMARWARLFPTLFPAGSDKGHDTKAQPAVWTDRAGFEKAANTLAEAADKLAVLAKAGDASGVANQLTVVQDDCKACHKTFKKR